MPWIRATPTTGAAARDLLLMNLVTVRDLVVANGAQFLLEGVHIDIASGESVALLGRSGAGKTLLARALLGLIPCGLKASATSLIVLGTEILCAPPVTLRTLRGGKIGFVFQDSLDALDPLRRVGAQIEEAIALHQPLSRASRQARCESLMAEVCLDRDDYPHALSGGERQRAALAIALANDPDLLIADEPTSALDPDRAAQLLALIDSARCKRQLATIFITHDFALARHHARRGVVLERGRIAECIEFSAGKPLPRTEIGRALAAAAEPPAPPAPVLLPASLPLLNVRDLTLPRLKLPPINFAVVPGETLAIIGPSGVGKTTILLAIARLIRSPGTIHLSGVDFSSLRGAKLRQMRRRLQILFQESGASLSPRMTVGAIIDEGLLLHHPDLTAAQRGARIAEALETLGLDLRIIAHHPQALSGGECQRIAIARALVLRPDVLLLDEPSAALDSVTRANLITTLRALQVERRFACVVATHDPVLAAGLAHRWLSLPRLTLSLAPPTPYTNAQSGGDHPSYG